LSHIEIEYPERSTLSNKPLSQSELEKLQAYWSAANYLSVGQIYLRKNPLLREPLVSSHIKQRLLGHWGTTPGINFIYAHLNRVIKKFDANMIYLAGPGHGGPALYANTYLEGSYSERYPDISTDMEGMAKLFEQFSWPGGVPSHVAPEVPGSIHEGGELGYALQHAFGAVLDNRDLIAACIVGDGEAETGPCAASWHSNKFIDPRRDGSVIPILHLNGYKIAGPSFLARMDEGDLFKLFEGYGYTPYLVQGSDPNFMHQSMAAALDLAMEQIGDCKRTNSSKNIAWPMIILRTPKGWTGPEYVDDLQVEGSFRSHQVPVGNCANDIEHQTILKNWLLSYRPGELFDESGKLIPELLELAPKGERRMGMNPHANGGELLRDLEIPDIRKFAVPVDRPGGAVAEATRVFGDLLRDVMSANTENFRIMCPDETKSNRLDSVFKVTNRTLNARIYESDENVAVDGRVMEVLSEHMCQGWLEGYLLSGRHGIFPCYEAFVHIVDSMFNQHAKWLKVTREIPWRTPIASLNYLLSSHVWRQDHNGFSHQDPGFIDHVINKKPEVVRVYLPPDANTLLVVGSACLASKNLVNVIVAGKQPSHQWFDFDAAVEHCSKGVGVLPWASNDAETDTDAVLACAGDIATIEVLAATQLLRSLLPDIKLRLVNVVDLLTLQQRSEHPHGLEDDDFDQLFTKDKPILFAYHGYPWLIHRLCYRRSNHKNLHVRGYKEEGSTTTPFDMVVRNDMDRFQMAIDVIKLIERPIEGADKAMEFLNSRRKEHFRYIREHGVDLPEITEWKWDSSLSK
jgi:xylulose-5-phosphate/fructose-6-phosphate phosphoketolase